MPTEDKMTIDERYKYLRRMQNAMRKRAARNGNGSGGRTASQEFDMVDVGQDRAEASEAAAKPELRSGSR